MTDRPDLVAALRIVPAYLDHRPGCPGKGESLDSGKCSCGVDAVVQIVRAALSAPVTAPASEPFDPWQGEDLIVYVSRPSAPASGEALRGVEACIAHGHYPHVSDIGSDTCAGCRALATSPAPVASGEAAAPLDVERLRSAAESALAILEDLTTHKASVAGLDGLVEHFLDLRRHLDIPLPIHPGQPCGLCVVIDALRAALQPTTGDPEAGRRCVCVDVPSGYSPSCVLHGVNAATPADETPREPQP